MSVFVTAEQVETAIDETSVKLAEAETGAFAAPAADNETFNAGVGAVSGLSLAVEAISIVASSFTASAPEAQKTAAAPVRQKGAKKSQFLGATVNTPFVKGGMPTARASAHLPKPGGKANAGTKSYGLDLHEKAALASSFATSPIKGVTAKPGTMPEGVEQLRATLWVLKHQLENPTQAMSFNGMNNDARMNSAFMALGEGVQQNMLKNVPQPPQVNMAPKPSAPAMAS